MDDLAVELANTPWAQRRTATGNASHVPSALLGLLSPDKNVRIKNYWRLDNEIVLQSDLYESAHDAIPFLIKMLEARPIHGRDLIYELLIEIALGNAPPDVTCVVQEGATLPLREACQNALRKGISIFLRDTEDSDQAIQSKSLELIDAMRA